MFLPKTLSFSSHFLLTEGDWSSPYLHLHLHLRLRLHHLHLHLRLHLCLDLWLLRLGGDGGLVVALAHHESRPTAYDDENTEHDAYHRADGDGARAGAHGRYAGTEEANLLSARASVLVAVLQLHA